MRAERPARGHRGPGREGGQAPGRGEADRRQPGGRGPAHRRGARGRGGADRDLPAPFRPGPGRAEAPARRRCPGPARARRGQHEVVPHPGVLRQRRVARHVRDGRRVADEPGRPLRRPAPLVHGPARRGHRGVHHAGAPDRGGGHRAGDRQVRLGRRRHHPVQHRGLPRLPAAPGDHRHRGHGDGGGRPDRRPRPGRGPRPGGAGRCGRRRGRRRPPTRRRWMWPATPRSSPICSTRSIPGASPRSAARTAATRWRSSSPCTSRPAPAGR